MRAFPSECFGLCIGVRKPEGGAVVMRDRKPQSFGCEGEPSHGRGHFETPLALIGAHKSCLSRRPCDCARRPERDLIDPFAPASREYLLLAVDIGGNQLAIIARGENA